jgi:lipopolysaccharide biosynthesis glycosyltransferase
LSEPNTGFNARRPGLQQDISLYDISKSFPGMSDQRSTEVFYATDAGFAVPTLASIASLRRWPSAKNLAVNVLLLGMTEPQVAAFEERSADLSIKLHTLANERLADFNNKNFNQTHVPLTTLARFLIPEFNRDNELSDVLYVDGDTWFVRDPKDLIELPAPELGLLASEDQSSFYVNDIGATGKVVSAYFNAIGVDRSKGYFNAGVLKCRTGEWARLSDGCLAFLRSNLAICRYHDQSALNAVAGKIRTRLSPAWNFQTPYWAWNVTEFAEPKLLHFVGGPKPWMGMLRAWSAIYPEYSAAIRQRSHGLFPLKIWNDEEQRQSLEQERRAGLKNRSIFLFRVARRRSQFRNLVRTAII